MFTQAESIAQRYEKLTQIMTQPDIINDQAKFKQYSIEMADLQPIYTKYTAYKEAELYSIYVKNLIAELDCTTNPDLYELYKEELQTTADKIKTLTEEIKQLLLPSHKDDSRNVIMELRAGAGGDEAALFVQDLYNMYCHYAIKNNWTITTSSVEICGTCGLKEVIFTVTGNNVYSKLKYEAGVHRVQRVPATETKGRVHTSTATVAVYPERTALELELDPKDVRIDLYHSGGKGGQNVNKVETAIRLTHIPTGIVVACQDERSQLKNKERAFEILRARLFDHYNSKIVEQDALAKKTMIGTGDRSEKIRTYNYPQHRITDHRISYSTHDFDTFMLGNLDELVTKLQIAENTQIRLN